MSLNDQIADAEKGIRAGFIAALISLAITTIITVLGISGTTDYAAGANWYMLFDIGLIAIFAIGIGFKSRTAATAMFLYFLLSKTFFLIEGQYNGILMGLVFLYFYGRAMICSFRYHSLMKKGVIQTDVF